MLRKKLEFHLIAQAESKSGKGRDIFFCHGKAFSIKKRLSRRDITNSMQMRFRAISQENFFDGIIYNRGKCHLRCTRIYNAPWAAINFRGKAKTYSVYGYIRHFHAVEILLNDRGIEKVSD
eukprot:TRINITY_DN1587_c0_g2_i1.p2 TRINITY_DN1587_c0_g2~~TRINITY_DN1587_c0_g2_i1.p2  ORF type:complete len:121 (-),score=18.19 TRINITY_DN1587_c0_g2_i1:744-1106(-)